MKKLFQLGAVFFCILMTQTVSAENYSSSNYGSSNNGSNYGSTYASSGSAEANVIYDNEHRDDHPCEDQATGDCYCKYVKYEPCYYTTKRCVQEQIPCTKKCCRYVDQYYEVKKCKYVPEYYTETKSCKVPEYYEVPDCKTCTKTICEKHCKYVPKYYWKHTCGDNSGCTRPCPTR